MPHKNLSVATTEDQETYAAGEEMAKRTGRSMSQFVIHLIRQAVDTERGMEILKPEVNGVVKRFRGRWIVQSRPSIWTRGIAETGKGNIAVYAGGVINGSGDLFRVYESWSEIEGDVLDLFTPSELDTACEHFGVTPLLDI